MAQEKRQTPEEVEALHKAIQIVAKRIAQAQQEQADDVAKRLLKEAGIIP